MPEMPPDSELRACLDWVVGALRRYLERYGHRLTGANQGREDLHVSLREVRASLAGAQAIDRPGLDLPPAPPPTPPPRGPRVAALQARFGLDTTDVALLLAAAATHLHTDLSRLATFAWSDFTARLPTVGFLCDLVGLSGPTGAALERFRPHAPLVAERLIRLTRGDTWSTTPPVLHARVRVPEAVLAWLRGEPSIESAGRDGIRVWGPGMPPAPLVFGAETRLRLQAGLDALFDDGPAGRSIILTGLPGSGRRSAIRAEAARRSRPVFEVDARRLPIQPVAAMERLGDAIREVRLWGGVLLLRGGRGLEAAGETPGSRLAAWLPALDGVRFALTVHEPDRRLREALGDPVLVPVPVPDGGLRLRLWRDALGPESAHFAADLAQRYATTAGAINAAARAARDESRMLGAQAGGAPGLRAYTEALRRRIDHAMSAVAERVSTTLDWPDVVLPDEVMQTLQEIRAQARHRVRVYDEWGFRRKMAYGRGLACLFAGPPGTGKTMMAGILAADLGRDLYRVDLSRVVSKWVGETEKNLAAVFDEAERAQVILFFDEADSLFSSRTEVKGANDRFANMEVNYLLQRMEGFDGMSILATNFERGLDEAFKRRLKFRVHFPLPDASERALLWQRMVPEATPVSGPIDWGRLGQRYKMSGGNIRNAVLRAAFYAADAEDALTYARLRRAAEAELREMGRL